MQTVFITGSTSGIGLALAQQYLASGWRVITHGRQNGVLAGAEHIIADLLAEDCAAQVLAQLASLEVTHLDLVIQNAALAWAGELPSMAEADLRALVQVNLVAPIRLTHALHPHLEAARGTVAFIGSIASAIGAPYYAVYAATKAALDGFARSLRLEWQAQGIGVRLYWPGATKTTLHAKAGMTEAQISKIRFMSADAVASKIRQKIAQRQDGALNGFMRLATWIGPKFPRLVDGLQKCFKRPPQAHFQAQRHIFITGCAEGIGRALWENAEQRGWKLSGVDYAPCQDALLADLTSQAGLTDTGQFLQENLGIDLLVHNAGISAAGRFERLPWEEMQRVLDLNFLAPLVLTRGILAAGPQVQWIFLSSLSHQVSYPGAAVYAATKDGVAHFARSLRVAGQSALTVFPGPVRTRHAERYSPDNTNAAKRMAPEILASKILSAACTKASFCIPGWKNRLISALAWWLPRIVEKGMLKAIYAKLP